MVAELVRSPRGRLRVPAWLVAGSQVSRVTVLVTSLMAVVAVAVIVVLALT